jgi:hypothetical protein
MPFYGAVPIFTAVFYGGVPIFKTADFDGSGSG